MKTVKDLECKAVDVFEEINKLTKHSAFSTLSELDEDEQKKYSVGTLNIFTCGTWCKEIDTESFSSDKEWIEIVDDWNNMVVLPFAESLRRFIKLHPDFDIPHQLTSVESGTLRGICTKQSLVATALDF